MFQAHLDRSAPEIRQNRQNIKRYTGPVFVAAAVVFLRSKQIEFQDYFISDGFLFFNHPTDGSGCCTAEAESVKALKVES